MVKVAIYVFDGLTALDAVGPYEVLQRIPGASVRWVSKDGRAVRTDSGIATLGADTAMDELDEVDVLVVPGGPGANALVHDGASVAWVRDRAGSARWTASVCTGSLLLGAAGLLAGKEATTHWAFLDQLAEYGAIPTSRRVVFQDSVVTAAGVSAGIDMSLHLCEKLVGPELAQAIQLGIEYDPQPPFDAGSPDKVVPALAALTREFVLAETASWMERHAR